MSMRVVLGGLAFVAAATALAVLVTGGVGLLAWAAFLALRAEHSAPWAAGWVGAGMLVLAALAVAPLLRRGARRALSGVPPTTARTPASLAWLEREPMAAGVLALVLGFGAARSRRVRRVVEDILRDWPAAP